MTFKQLPKRNKHDNKLLFQLNLNYSTIVILDMIVSYLCFLISVVFTSAYNVESEEDAMRYLQTYGYLSSPDSSVEDEKMTEGITMFQKFNGLEETGQLTSLTMEQMNKPRCGMAERMDMMENKKMNMRTVSHKIPRKPGRWETSRIFYKVHNFPDSNIEPDVVTREIRRAFRLWERAANIECVELAKDEDRMVEIDISFETGDHGDGSEFGSTIGNAVAHAFFPNHRRYRGNIHFDNSRLWTAYNLTEINLYQVMSHEIGHALGLDHSRFPESVMHMIVHSKLEDNFDLHSDDIMSIRNLYGPKPKRRRKGKGLISQKFKQTTPRSWMTNFLPLLPTTSSTSDKNTIVSPEGTISVQKIDIPTLGSSVTNFWNCFKLLYNPETSKEARNCYTQNTLRLLYYIKNVDKLSN